LRKRSTRQTATGKEEPANSSPSGVKRAAFGGAGKCGAPTQGAPAKEEYKIYSRSYKGLTQAPEKEKWSLPRFRFGRRRGSAPVPGLGQADFSAE